MATRNNSSRKQQQDKQPQNFNDSKKIAIPTQGNTLSTETVKDVKQAIEQASTISHSLLENPTQVSDSELKKGVDASKNAVSTIQTEMPVVEPDGSFLDSLKKEAPDRQSSLVTSGIQRQWQSHKEVIKCFNETSFSMLRGSIWH